MRADGRRSVRATLILVALFVLMATVSLGLPSFAGRVSQASGTFHALETSTAVAGYVEGEENPFALRMGGHVLRSDECDVVQREFFSLSLFREKYIDAGGTVLGFAGNRSAEETIASCERELSERGWTRTESGMASSAAFVREAREGQAFHWFWLSGYNTAHGCSVTALLPHELMEGGLYERSGG